MVSADNGNGKERKRNRKAGTVLCTQMEDRTVSFYIKEWVQNRKEPGKGIWEIKLSNVIIFCHCNADIKSDLSWNGKYYVVAQEKARKFLNRIHLKKQFMIWEFLEGRKVHRAMVCPEYVLSGKD